MNILQGIRLKMNIKLYSHFYIQFNSNIQLDCHSQFIIDRQHMSPSRSSYSRSRSQKRRRRSSSSSRKQKKNTRHYPNKEIGGITSSRNQGQDKSSDLKLVTKPQESDIKNHFKFENVKIKKKSSDIDPVSDLKYKLQQLFGPVEHVTKLSETQSTITLLLGFKYDSDALELYESQGILETTYNKEKVKFIPTPTKAFKQFIPYLKDLKTAEKVKEKKRSPEHPHKNEKSSHGERKRRSPSFEKKRRSSRSSSSVNKKKKERKRYSSESSDNKHRGRKSPEDERDHLKNSKRLLIFGLPSYLKGKKIEDFFSQHPNGPFYLSHWKWKKLGSSNCEYMEIILEDKKAKKLLELREELLYDKYPIVLTTGLQIQNQDKIKESLRQFQLVIKLPARVDSAIVYKGISQCGRVVQMVSLNKLVDNTSDSFLITLNSITKAYQLRKLARLASGINVEIPEDGQLVYRPTKESKLLGEQKRED